MSTYTAIRARMTVASSIPSDRRVLWQMSKGRCFWCDGTMLLGGEPTHPKYMTVDHIHVRSSGMSRANAKVPSCRQCNIERGATPAEEYWQVWVGRLAECAG